MDSIRAVLDLDGFIIVQDVLTSEIVQTLQEDIQTALSCTERPQHAMRLLMDEVPKVKEIASRVAVRSLVESALGPKGFVVRSIFFDKTPEANWKVAWHQDLTIAVRRKIETDGFSAWSLKDEVPHVQPPASILERMLTIRLHLDDCGPENGALQVIPGSHKVGKLSAEAIAEWRKRNAIVCSTPRGGALLMRPLLLHASSPADTPKHRRVVHLEFAAESLPGGLQWSEHS